MEGDGDANYAYYALHKLKIRIKDFNEMDTYEKAMTMACIDIKTENEKKEAAKIKK